MNPDPKWLELLKASGWQTAAVALGCGIAFAIIKVGWIDSPGAIAIFGLVLVGVICLLLSAASALSALFRFIPPGKWIVHWRNIARERKATREYIPHMTQEEKAIIGYLLHHNQKMFTGASDGGYATTLISRRIVVQALQPGQMFSVEDMPFAVPDHVWDVLAKHRDAFPAPARDAPYPWRVPWDAR